MVGDAALWEIVSANALGPIATAHQRFSFSSLFSMRGALFSVQGRMANGTLFLLGPLLLDVGEHGLRVFSVLLQRIILSCIYLNVVCVCACVFVFVSSESVHFFISQFSDNYCLLASLLSGFAIMVVEYE